MTKQRNVLISYVLFYGGFIILILSIFVILGYSLFFRNVTFNFVHCICLLAGLVGLIMPTFASNYNLYFYFSMHNPQYVVHMTLRNNSDTGFIQGVPNNNYKEFLNFKIIDCFELDLYYSKGIFTGKIKNQNVRIDMNGWLFKKKYLYELYQTYFIINYLKYNGIPLKKISKKIIDDNIKEASLVIHCGNKKKVYKLAYDGKIKSRFSLKIKNRKKYRFVKNDDYSIFNFYNLSKK